MLDLDEETCVRYAPSPYIRRGEFAMHLGSGTGNVCFRAAQTIDLLNEVIPTASVDVVLFNCEPHTLGAGHKATLCEQLFRMIRHGGRAVISDIVSSQDVPAWLRKAPELWSGSSSGALREDRFVAGVSEAGFDCVKIVALSAAPVRTLAGIEFRSITIVAEKRSLHGRGGALVPGSSRLSAGPRGAACERRADFRTYGASSWPSPARV